MEVRPEKAKTGPLAGNCIIFRGMGARRKFFRAKTPPEEAVGMVGTEVGALFRFKSSCPKSRSGIAT